MGVVGLALNLLGGLLWHLDGGNWEVFFLALAGFVLTIVVGLGVHWWWRRKMTKEQRQELEPITRFREKLQ